jgi:hypothetical protein
MMTDNSLKDRGEGWRRNVNQIVSCDVQHIETLISQSHVLLDGGMLEERRFGED